MLPALHLSALDLQVVAMLVADNLDLCCQVGACGVLAALEKDECGAVHGVQQCSQL